ncbi:MAG TPA: CCA tRNA nucleotidyltransferase [Patescibacteria group bacterium]|nr:CCA tRNA nucleotidyltransferase [Patescibacteria group bacterium]
MTVYNGKLARKAWMVADETVRVMQALMATGVEARFVGGCVRNALVNRDVLDIDIATPLLPEAVIEHLQAADIKYVPTGLSHGTVTAIVDGKTFEITTLRVDVDTDGRHAEVAFTNSWEEDAARRDFTINAMSANLEGDVFDPFTGIEDLRKGRVIFVGYPEQRIEEDVLRILRFFRFFAHFGQGRPDAAALVACAKLSTRLPRLSPERIRTEALKILESDRCALTWEVMENTGVVANFLPEATGISALKKLLALEQDHHSHAFVLRRLAALLEVDGAESLMKVTRALRLSNDQARALMTLVRPADAVSTHMTDAAMRQLVYRHGNDMARSLLLLAAAKAGEEGEGNLDALYDLATAFRPPRFPLQGDDVLGLGIQAGPEVGRILSEMESWWLAEDFRPGRTEALAKLRARAGDALQA